MPAMVMGVGDAMSPSTRRVPAPLLETNPEDLEVPLQRLISPTAACRGALDGGTPQCLLVECRNVGPTCADAPDEPRREFSEFRRLAAELSREFFCSHDVPGMVGSLSALGCACFHDELVSILLRGAMDRKEAERDAVVSLLGALTSEGLLTSAQSMRGFEKLILAWEDLRLDVPDAPGRLVALLSSKVGLVDRSFFPRLPEGLLANVLADMPPGPPTEALREHLEDLRAFKAALASHLQANPLDDGSALEAWLRCASRAGFHHEVVAALAGRVFDANAVASPEEAAKNCRQAVGVLARLRRGDADCDCDGDGAVQPVLEDEDVQLGFSRLLGIIEERSAAQKTLVALLRGVVEQELLPAEFLKCTRRLRFGGPRGVEVLREVQRQTPMHSRRAWGTGDARQFRLEVRMAILEYFDSRSVEELARIMQELHLSPKEQVDFMRKLLVTALELGEAEAALDAVESLLGFFWSHEEVREAFEQLRDIAKDWVLDFPRCRECTTDLVYAATGRGLLEKSYLVSDVNTNV
eukprot:TRINITY_DN7944_c0_g1_i1.p1 TRINITY_DN7944_c0_g1~~TRINITY_DN7944_c0_g1_i1.p1  ORF type:complete len:525 (+),score=127.69 TRINITY_DN7944_c0_g1_i1:76-1650(+)